jgi:SAM-dependent methyltransferase
VGFVTVKTDAVDLPVEDRSRVGSLVGENELTSLHDTSFNDTQYALPYGLGVENHFWNVARNRIIERALRVSARELVRPDATILDVGCGPGITVAYLRSKGFNCTGVEIGVPPIRPEAVGFVTVKTDAVDLPVEDRSRVGTILLLDVIEHIRDPIVFLRNIADAFSYLERVVVAVPARMELWSNYDAFYGHFIRYDKASLRDVIDRAGFVVTSIRYFFNTLYVPMWLVVHVSKKREVEWRAPTAVLLHKFIGVALALEARTPLLGCAPGTSLLAILMRR